MRMLHGRRLEPLVKATDSAGHHVFKVIAAKSKRIYSKSAQEYRIADDSNYDLQSHAYFRSELSKITSALGRDLSVLDLGCGTGRYFHCLKNTSSITGVDVSEEMLELAKRPSRASEIAASDIKLIRDDIHSVSFGDGAFDFVYAIGVLGLYSPFTIELSDKIYEWLKPGGCVYLYVVDASTPTTSSWKRDLAIRLYPVLPKSMQSKVFLRVQNFGITLEELRLAMDQSRFVRWQVVSSQDLDPLRKVWRRSFFTVSAVKEV